MQVEEDELASGLSRALAEMVVGVADDETAGRGMRPKSGEGRLLQALRPIAVGLIAIDKGLVYSLNLWRNGVQLDIETGLCFPLSSSPCSAMAVPLTEECKVAFSNTITLLPH